MGGGTAAPEPKAAKPTPAKPTKPKPSAESTKPEPPAAIRKRTTILDFATNVTPEHGTTFKSSVKMAPDFEITFVYVPGNREDARFLGGDGEAVVFPYFEKTHAWREILRISATPAAKRENLGKDQRNFLLHVYNRRLMVIVGNTGDDNQGWQTPDLEDKPHVFKVTVQGGHMTVLLNGEEKYKKVLAGPATFIDGEVHTSSFYLPAKGKLCALKIVNLPALPTAEEVVTPTPEIPPVTNPPVKAAPFAEAKADAADAADAANAADAAEPEAAPSQTQPEATTV